MAVVEANISEFYSAAAVTLLFGLNGHPAVRPPGELTLKDWLLTDDVHNRIILAREQLRVIDQSIGEDRIHNLFGDVYAPLARAQLAFERGLVDEVENLAEMVRGQRKLTNSQAAVFHEKVWQHLTDCVETVNRIELGVENTIKNDSIRKRINNFGLVGTLRKDQTQRRKSGPLNQFFSDFEVYANSFADELDAFMESINNSGLRAEQKMNVPEDSSRRSLDEDVLGAEVISVAFGERRAKNPRLANRGLTRRDHSHQPPSPGDGMSRGLEQGGPGLNPPGSA